MESQAQKQKKIKEKLAVDNCHNFCVDVFNACKDGYINISINKLIQKHKVPTVVTKALKNLGLIKAICASKNSNKSSSYYWPGKAPSENTATNLLAEIRRIFINDSMAKRINEKTRKLVPLVVPQKFDREACFRLIKSIYRDHPEALLIDARMLIKDKKIPDGFFEALLSLGVLQNSSMGKDFYIWVGDAPSLAMAELVSEEVSSKSKIAPAVVTNKPAEKFAEKKRLALEKTLDFMNALKQRLDKKTTFSIASMLAGYKLDRNLGYILLNQGIISKSGDLYTWEYKGNINMDFVVNFRNGMYAASIAKAKKSDKKNKTVTHNPSHASVGKIKPHTEPIASPANDIMAGLKKEEKDLEEFIRELPQSKRLEKIRQIIKLTEELNADGSNADDDNTELIKEKILGHMRRYQPATLKGLCDALNLPKHSVHYQLKILIDSGEVLKIKHGNYKLN